MYKKLYLYLSLSEIDQAEINDRMWKFLSTKMKKYFKMHSLLVLRVIIITAIKITVKTTLTTMDDTDIMIQVISQCSPQHTSNYPKQCTDTAVQKHIICLHGNSFYVFVNHCSCSLTELQMFEFKIAVAQIVQTIIGFVLCCVSI